MSRLSNMPPPMIGALCAVSAVMFMSVSDMALKLISGGYALHELILLRTLIGMMILFAVIMPLTGEGREVFRTKRLKLHMFRGFSVFIANMTFFLGLVALPLADAVAIFFVSPLIITIFSVIFLGEKVGRWRWVAVGIGLLGVTIMLRPGGDTFRIVALLPLAAAVAYAGLHTLTRKLGTTESASTMGLYTQLVFIGFCVVIGLFIGDGKFATQSDPSLTFLFNKWVWPSAPDIPYILLIGVAIGFGGWLISHAYKVAELAVVAPFEYLAMPLSIFWGVVVFGEWPDGVAWIGIALIFGAGLLVIWRESLARQKEA